MRDWIPYQRAQPRRNAKHEDERWSRDSSEFVLKEDKHEYGNKIRSLRHGPNLPNQINPNQDLEVDGNLQYLQSKLETYFG